MMLAPLSLLITSGSVTVAAVQQQFTTIACGSVIVAAVQQQ